MVQLCCAVVVTQVVKLFSPITRTSSMVLFLISYISHNFLFRHQEAVAAKTVLYRKMDHEPSLVICYKTY